MFLKICFQVLVSTGMKSVWRTLVLAVAFQIACSTIGERFYFEMNSRQQIG